MVRPRLIIILVLGLTLFGLIMIGSASVVDASRDFGDKWYYFRLQSIWASIGTIAFLFFSNFPHRKLEKYASLLFVFSIILLVAVLIPGVGLKLLGARRWIDLGFFNFQPAEAVKLTLCIYLAKLLQHKVNFIGFLSMLGLTSFLVLLEPDLGTALVITGTGILTYYGHTGNYKPLLLSFPFAILGVGLLIFLSPYRLARLKTFFNHVDDPLGSSYHIHQAIIGFGSGGLFGLGLGQSHQKYEFLPESMTDSIFSIIGEEIGYIGAFIVIGMFTLLIINSLQISKQVTHPFSQTLALSISSWLGIQTLLNISAITALVPLTGVPLPLISYGGSSLLILLIALGILVNISRSIKNA